MGNLERVLEGHWRVGGSRCWSRGASGRRRRPQLPQHQCPISGLGGSQKKRQAGFGSMDEMKRQKAAIPAAFSS